MSLNENPSPQIDSAANADAKAWPDLSAYGVTLGVVESDQGRKSLVFSDETGKFSHIARSMGFSRTRWPGLWVRNDIRIEPTSFRNSFPKLEISMLSASEISDRILDAIRARTEVSNQFSLPGFGVADQLGAGSPPKAKKTAVANAIHGSVPDEGMVLDLSPLSVEATPMGTNRLGEEVFETPDGRRFSRIETEAGPRIRKEAQRAFPDATESGLFLRGDTPESLDVAAEGLVWAMAHGRTVRVDDFAQFFRAVTGRVMPKNVSDDPDFSFVASAVDRARVRRLSDLASTPDADAFAAALRLHEAAQYYTLISDSRMTPLPMAVALQHVASAMPEGSTIRVTNAERGEFRILSGGAFKEAAEGQAQDILLGAFDGNLLERATETFGTVVAREDHAQTLTNLEKMSSEGLGIFVIDGDAIAGRIGPSSRRFLDVLATHHEIEGMVDVDGMLMGVPGSLPKRIIVVGKKKEVPTPPVLPDSLPYVTDYESLWMWSDRITQAISKPGSVSLADRGAVSNTETMEATNSYQSPYIPTSTLSEPTLMVPRNLASPLRRAMIEIQRETPHTDQWLADQLGMSMEQLRESLSPEQADAAVMAFKRIEQGMGFMVADQTGTGKGRILAASALRQRLRGEPVVFLTEKADLFTDFWRDLENIGADQFFKNVLVLNDGVKVTSTKTGEVVAMGASRDKLQDILRSMEIPQEVDLVMATYSQFNRDPIKASRKSTEINFDALTRNQVSDAVAKMVERARRMRQQARLKPVKDVAVDSVDIFADPEIINKMPMEALKPLWIGRVTKGKALIMDESHNAAGEDSQTAMNIIHATMNAKSVIYSSATFARGEKNMRAYRRLFPDSVDVEGLHETLKKGGEPLQEALSSMLAEDGALVRREHDLSQVTFMPQLDTKRTERNEALADQLAEVLAAIGSLSREVREYSDSLSENLRTALEAANAAAGKQGTTPQSVGVVQMPNNGNSLYTTMRAFLLVIKNDLTVERAVEHLKEGRKPGIIVEHTMEADLNRAIAHAKEKGTALETDDGLVIPRPSFRTLLRSMLQDMCNVSLDGRDLEIRTDPKFANAVRMIEKLVDAFPDLPLCPIDYIRQGIEKAGYKCGELSGRKNRLVDLGDGRCLVQKIPANARSKAKDGFNNGDVDAIVITRAGNSGISLHASPTFINTQQRVVIEAEVPEDVVVRVQFFGRFNRKDQLSHPIVETLSSNLPAENRILAIQNNKMRKLSANVTANRDNAAITRDVADILNVVGNEVAFNYLELRPEMAIKLDINMPSKAEQEMDHFNLNGDRYVSQLFSKMVLMPVAQQREMIKDISDEFTNRIKELDSIGENPLRAKFFDIHATKVASEDIEVGSKRSIKDDGLVVHEEQGLKKSTFDRPVQITEIEYNESYKAITKEELHRNLISGRDRFRENVADLYGSEVAKLAKSDCGPVFEFIIDAVLDRREAHMEHLLAARHKSVADALAEQENNAVKIAQWKTDKIVEVLSSIDIGSAIQFTDRDSRNTVSGLIERIDLPKESDLLSPGRYWLSVRQPGRHFRTEISLSQLIQDPSFKVLAQRASDQFINEFTSQESIVYKRTRNILDGNLFRAAEMSIALGIGTQAHFSDAHGQAHRAVVLPVDAKKDEFNKLPVRIKDRELAARYLREVHSGELNTATSHKSVNGLSIRKTGTEIIVSMPGTTSKIAWLKNNHELMAVTGPFAGSRSSIMASVPFADSDRLIHALYKAGMTLYAHSAHITCPKPLPSEFNGRYISETRAKQLQEACSTREWFVKEMALDDGLSNKHGANAGAFKDPLDELDRPSTRTRFAA